MGRSLDEIITSLPRDQQEQIEARYEELKQEVEGLRELREIAVGSACLRSVRSTRRSPVTAKPPPWTPYTSG